MDDLLLAFTSIRFYYLQMFTVTKYYNKCITQDSVKFIQFRARPLEAPPYTHNTWCGELNFAPLFWKIKNENKTTLKGSCDYFFISFSMWTVFKMSQYSDNKVNFQKYL